jgi:predicted transcriptional regulator YheO
MKNTDDFESSIRFAKAIAGQFGPNCEVVIHDLRGKNTDHSIIYIENGHVTGRTVGDGPSGIVLESLKEDASSLEDRIAYLTRTSDGRVLRSTTVYIRDVDGNVIGIMGINYDISSLIALENSLHSFNSVNDYQNYEPEPIVTHVSDLLEDLLSRSERLIGKPTALMNKDEKLRAIKFLDDSSAFLITKSGPKVCEYYGISTYTLYSYLYEIRSIDK